ncbi:hypothetical protein DFH09DRAFT_1080165 [Mycena vulgaris]|nr:hypothetical protein DFH09DRAFT_1080165 [Mycena vulgaris]
MQLRRVTRKGTRRDPKRSRWQRTSRGNPEIGEDWASSENDGRQPKRPGKISSEPGLKASLSPPGLLELRVLYFDCKSPQGEEQERERRKSKAVIITLMRTNVPIKRTTKPPFKLRDSSSASFHSPFHVVSPIQHTSRLRDENHRCIPFPLPQASQKLPCLIIGRLQSPFQDLRTKEGSGYGLEKARKGRENLGTAPAEVGSDDFDEAFQHGESILEEWDRDSPSPIISTQVLSMRNEE